MTTPDAISVVNAVISQVDIVAAWDARSTDRYPIVTPLELYEAEHSPQIARAADPHTSLGFMEHLHNVTANPNDRMKSAITLGYFVFPTTADNDAVNGSEVSLTRAVEDWITKASVYPANYVSTAGRSEGHQAARYDLIVGDRGVGKTFLQNYIVTKYSKMLDDRRVLWIRINLARGFGDVSDINDWVKAQITKILCRYYDRRSTRFPGEPNQDRSDNRIEFDFDQIFADYADLIDSPRSKVLTMLRVLRRQLPTNDRDIHPNLIPPDVADLVFDQAVKAGLGFIVVFDGLDLLGNTETSKALFRKRTASLAEYLASQASLWRYHLLFTRRESLTAIDNAITQPLKFTAVEARPVTVSKVSPVALSAVYERRLTALSEDSLREQIGGYTKSDINDFATFFESTPSGLEQSGDVQTTFKDALCNTLGTNTRAAMQVLQAAARQFTEQVSNKHYALTDLMMRMGRALPPRPPAYVPSAEPNLSEYARLHSSSHHTSYEATFLPSIFRFPYLEGSRSAGMLDGKDMGQILMGLRILQIVAFMNAGSGLLEDATKKTIWKNVCEIFKYAFQPVHAFIDELLDEEVLQASFDPNLHPWDDASRSITLTPKGKKILGLYMFDLAYLNVSAYNLPCPRMSSGNKGPFFVVVPASRAPELPRIVFGKVMNGICLGKLLIEANIRQQRAVMSGAMRLSEPAKAVLTYALAHSIPNHGGLFSFADGLMENLRTTAEKSLAGLYSDKANYLDTIAEFERFGVVVPRD